MIGVPWQQHHYQSHLSTYGLSFMTKNTSNCSKCHSLVSAIIVATSQTTSQQHADKYLQLMVQYCELLHKQFPDYEALPNHHMAMHLGEFLLMYGPVHS